MKTKIKDRLGNIPTLNFGIAFLQIFVWLNLLLLTLLFGKGIETIFNSYELKTSFGQYISFCPSSDNITWMFFIYFLLFINFVVFSLRYLFWAPWPIYNKIFNLRRIEESAFPKIKINENNECVKGAYSNIDFNRLVWGLTNSNGFEIFWSGMILLVEFYISYLGIMSLDNIYIFIASILALPITDFLFPFISSIFLIRRKHFKGENIKNYFNSKGVKHYFKSRKWLLPWAFIRPFFYDVLIPILFIILFIIYIIFTNKDNITIENISTLYIIENYKFQLIIMTILSLSLTNLLVIKYLKEDYYNVAHVLFKLNEIKKEIQSPNRPKPYINGICKFMGYELYIDERVYPPTRETEYLVKCAIDELNKYKKSKEKTPIVLDVGTGSGNIAISIAMKIEKVKIIAIDKSNDALDLAHENILKHNINKISLQESDLLKNIHNRELNNPDLIVANLPYGSHDFLLDSNPVDSIKFMPTVAVFPSSGIVGDYVSLVNEILNKGWKTVLLVEIGPVTEKVIREEFDKILEKITYSFLTTNEKEHEGNEKRVYSVLKIEFNYEK